MVVYACHVGAGSLGDIPHAYTVEPMDKEHIFGALFDSKCVAVGHHPGDYERLTGSLELVEYAGFLIREFLPLHDEICSLESKLYMRIIEGKDEYDPMLDRLKAQLEQLYRKYWA